MCGCDAFTRTQRARRESETHARTRAHTHPHALVALGAEFTKLFAQLLVDGAIVALMDDEDDGLVISLSLPNEAVVGLVEE